jgi:hypothetical protein
MSLEDYFPALASTGYRVTSPAAAAYNCFAWAVGVDDLWWEPDPGDDGYWPAGVKREQTLPAIAAAFGTLGFLSCSDGALEPGFEKVAIYALGDRPTHAARQKSDGRWTSKLGPLEDIEHELAGLVGQEYGTVALFLRRPVKP